MHLAKVSIKNFRNLKALEVALRPGLNVLVGENNVGKTNFLDAIRVALGAASGGEPVRLAKEDRHRNLDGTWEDPIRIDLVFDALTADEQAEFLDALDFNAADPTKSTASVHYEWSWSDQTGRWTSRRWGGDRSNSQAVIPDDVLQSVPLTLLTALRDAQSALAPGRRSRLGQLLQVSATEEQRKSLEGLIDSTNKKLQEQPLITNVEARIKEALEGASGPRFRQTPVIRASEPEFERIVNNLRLVLSEVMKDIPEPLLSELRFNGLGYNNLLYIGTVLAELVAAKDRTLPLLLVEEPEAHLHPQLQTLLADFLSKGGTHPGAPSKVQTIVTTHSPTIAAHVDPQTIRVLHRPPESPLACVSVEECGLENRELKQLRRMFDVTKASLLFAKGVLLVEGISEALLVPALGRRLGYRLEDAGVSVIFVAGVDFKTLTKLFGPKKLRIPIAIVTDADPPVVYAEGKDRSWENATPAVDEKGRFKCGKRLAALRDDLAGTGVEVFASDVTLEYDLAAAGPKNAGILFSSWKSLYKRAPENLTEAQLAGATSAKEAALLFWQAVCVGNPKHGKAELAQALAAALEDRKPDDSFVVPEFTVPSYLERAIKYVFGKP